MQNITQQWQWQQWLQLVRSQSLTRLSACSAEVGEVQAALAAAFPHCQDLNNDPARDITRFIPHLSIGQFKNAAAAEEAGKVHVDLTLPPRSCFSLLRALIATPLGGKGGGGIISELMRNHVDML